MALVIFERKREVKRIDSLGRIDTDIEVASTDSIDEIFVFVLWIDDDDIVTKHERTEDLKLHCKRFTAS